MSPRIAQLRSFLELRPNDPFVHYALALELKQAGEAAESEVRFREVLQRFPEYVPTYFHFGQLLEELGQTDEARTIYERGIACAARCGDSHAERELRGALGLLP